MLKYFIILLSLTLCVSAQFVKLNEAPFTTDSGENFGALAADFDNDGDMDIFVVRSDGDKKNFYYKNLDNGSFEKVTSGILVEDTNISYGCTSADFDNDGDVDIYVCNFNEPDYLYVNDGSGNFTKDTSYPFSTVSTKSSSATFGDYDNDGYMDIFVACEGEQNRLYKGDGSGGFIEVNDPVISQNINNSISAVFVDLNSDVYPDIFVTNAGQSNCLYLNQQDGTFIRVDDTVLTTEVSNSTGASFGDFNNDGLFDCYVTTGYTGNYFDLFYENTGTGFNKITDHPALTSPTWSGGSSWLDFNSDGYLDIFVGGKSGINALYKNDGDGQFSFHFDPVLVNDGQNVSAVVSADFDNNGTEDLFLARSEGTNSLIFNNNTPQNWLKLKLRGENSSYASVGAVAELFVSNSQGDSKLLSRQLITQTGGSRSSQNSDIMYFGLGDYYNIEFLTIYWSHGEIESYEDIEINRLVTITQGLSSIGDENTPNDIKILGNYPNPFNPETTLKFTLPSIYSGDTEVLFYNSKGEFVKKSIVGNRGGVVTLKFNGVELNSGVYHYLIKAGSYRAAGKMTLIK